MDLVPLQIRIGLKGGRMHKYPPFNELPAKMRGRMDWAHFIDQYGGMQYDQTCGHDDIAEDSPHGCFLSMILVPPAFAQESVARWPEQCRALSETEATYFYDCRCHVTDPEIIEDGPTLMAIAAKKQLGIDDEDGHDSQALDPDHPAIGRRRNRNNRFYEFVKARKINIVSIAVETVTA